MQKQHLLIVFVGMNLLINNSTKALKKAQYLLPANALFYSKVHI